MTNIFKEPLIDSHPEIIDEDNCRVSEVFETLLMGCTLGLLLVGIYDNGYSLMNDIYIIYFIISAVLFAFTRFYVRKHLQYTKLLIWFIMIEAYSYSVFSGIIFNLHAPSITVYALMVAASSAYIVPYGLTITFHSIMAIIYCALAISLKPEFGIQDTINYVFLLAMSFTLTYIIYRNRMDYLRALDESINQEEIAKEYAKSRNELIDRVPGGIGIFEIIDNKLVMSYINDAYYNMIGTSRELRKDFTKEKAINTIHPDDLSSVKEAINRLIAGDEHCSVVYRTLASNGKWMWINIKAVVIIRKEKYLKVNVTLNNFDEYMETQEDLIAERVMNDIALKNAKVVSWHYNYKTDQITNSGTMGEEYHTPEVIDNVVKWFIESGFVHKSSEADLRKLYASLINETTVEGEFRSNGTSIYGESWIHLIYTPVFDKNGNYVDYIGTAIDISKQKNQEIKYEETMKLSKALQSNSLATAHYNLTKDLITNYECQYDELDILFHHKSANSMLASTSETIKDNDERKKFDVIKDTHTMIESFINGISHIEIRHHIQDGTTWYQTTFDMIENPYTRDIEAVSSLLDITEQVRSELVIDKLVDIDYHSVMIINSSNGATMPYNSSKRDRNLEEIIDRQTTTNDSQLTLEEFLNKYAVGETAKKAIKENSLDYIKERLEKSPYYECMYSLNQNDKTSHYRILYTYLENNHETILCSVQDVTEMYDQEERQKQELAKALTEAKAANKAKTAFLSRVSHDMRTPLNGILGMTNLVKAETNSPKVKSDLDELEVSGKYLLSLINDTLDVSKIESGKLELHPQVCRGKEIFNNAIKLARNIIKDRNLHLNINTEDAAFTTLYIDANRVEQVFMNIMGNAIKFTNDGGNIDVILSQVSINDDYVVDRIVVKDTGIGISKDYLPHIFEIFSQEDNSSTSNFQGTGLGMSITKQLVDLMKGDIRVESELGVGTTVTITLPFKIATDQQIKEYENKFLMTTSKYNLAGKRVLLFEDHLLNAKIATRLLKKQDMIVEHAINGAIGLQMFKNGPIGYYDIIIMDIRMPVMDGIETTQNIRALERQDARLIPIVAVTANAFSDDIEQTKNVGMDGHLSKPLQPDLLFTTLENLLKIDHCIRRKRLLVVDDVEINRAVIIKSIQADFDILEASNGKEALKLLEDNKDIDAIVTDIQMPEMDGIELINTVRADNKYRHLAIIANTQFGDAEQEEYLLKIGANDFIYKPSTPKVVEMRIRNVLRRI